jgi:uncharacterized membrane protein YidH (DUF202 family)
MMPHMLRRILLIALLLVTTASPSMAQSRRQVEEDPMDGRFYRYDRKVVLDGAGIGITWIIFVALAVVASAGLFKNARRTHLD